MTNSFVRLTIVCAGFVAVSMWLVGQTAFAGTTKVNCNKGESIQAAVDAGISGELNVFEINGTCTENVTVTNDDTTFTGKNNNSTVDGTITIFSAQRVTIDDLNVNSVNIFDNAGVNINDATIDSAGSNGVTALRAASVVMANTTVVATGNSVCAVFIGDGSVLRMNGGNELTSDAPGFICATLAVYRNSTARIRGSGNTITNEDEVVGGPDSESAGGFALDVEMVSSLRIDGTGPATINGNVESFNLSTVDLRNVEVNGGIYADGVTANVRLRGNSAGDVVVNGDVFPRGDSAVTIRNAGEVIINGNIDCFNGANVIDDFAHFGDPPPVGTDGYVNCPPDYGVP